jgi:uncharacterized protein
VIATCHPATAVKKPPTIWLIGDGKPGHENQSLGLAEAIARILPCDVHRISVAGKRGLLKRIKAASRVGTTLPKPDLIIAAGHATHPSLFWLARKHRAKSVVFMKPSLPMTWFDLCFVPAHDFSNGHDGGNLVLTRGAPNRVIPGEGEKTGKLILIGGPSKTHGWDGAALLDRLAQATDRGGWVLSDSRRTPEGFLDAVRRGLPGVTAFSHRDTPPGWVPDQLRQAKEVWVTEDSVSMIYEALTSGARVGLLPAPRLADGSRVLSGIDDLISEGFVTPFSRWQENHRITPPPETLREADRCAEIVLERLVRNGS